MYSTTDDLANLKNTTKNYREAAKTAKKEIEAVADKAGNKILKLIHSAGDEVIHARDAVTDQIRTNPVRSSLIALGAGFLLGAILRR